MLASHGLFNHLNTTELTPSLAKLTSSPPFLHPATLICLVLQIFPHKYNEASSITKLKWLTDSKEDVYVPHIHSLMRLTQSHWWNLQRFKWAQQGRRDDWGLMGGASFSSSDDKKPPVLILLYSGNSLCSFQLTWPAPSSPCRTRGNTVHLKFRSLMLKLEKWPLPPDPTWTQELQLRASVVQSK